MISFKYNCPHCGVVNGFFEVANFYRRKYEEVPIDIYAILGVCNTCGHGIVANCGINNEHKGKFALTRFSISTELWETLAHPKQNYDLFDLLGFEPDFQPKLSEPEITEHLPNDVLQKMRAAETLYIQSRGNSDLLDFAGSAYRKTLEFALAHLDDDSDKNLNWRINSLVSQGILVKPMGDFAHRIRLLGNEATHNEITLAELGQLRLFTQLFLQYTFTLPAMIPDEVKV